ncbi:MAG: hypothetical protein V3U53_03090 [bacterium]
MNEERRLLCPGCGKLISIPAAAGPGDLIDCPNCAGIQLRLAVEDGKEVLRLVQLVTCPACGERFPFDDDTSEGTLVELCGVEFKLTKEFGAFALEPVRP